MTVSTAHEERRRGCDPSTADFIQDFNQRRDPPVEREDYHASDSDVTRRAAGAGPCPAMI